MELKLTVDGLEKERDFYFSKLRDIELICQESESDSPILARIINILYATEVPVRRHPLAAHWLLFMTIVISLSPRWKFWKLIEHRVNQTQKRSMFLAVCLTFTDRLTYCLFWLSLITTLQHRFQYQQSTAYMPCVLCTTFSGLYIQGCQFSFVLCICVL